MRVRITDDSNLHTALVGKLRGLIVDTYNAPPGVRPGIRYFRPSEVLPGCTVHDQYIGTGDYEEVPSIVPAPVFDSSPAGRKNEKVRTDLVIMSMPRALLGVAKLMTWAQSKGYKLDDWLLVPDAERAYTGAAFRHQMEVHKGVPTDPESGLHHYIHEAWNVLAKLEIKLRELEPTVNE